ncbi:MAG: hypothetical protein AAGF11_30820 [Myxococcota bacterium]
MGPGERAHDDPVTIDDRLLAITTLPVGITVNRRQRTAIAISGMAHAALFAWVTGHDHPTTDAVRDRTHVSIERVVLEPPPPPPAPTPAKTPDAREPAMAAHPLDAARPPPPPPDPKPRTQRPRARPLTIDPESTADVVVDPPPEPAPAPPVAVQPAPPVPASAADGNSGRERTKKGSGDRAGSGWDSGGGMLDHSIYGRTIVQLFLDELDRSPVPGISKGHSITILLRVSPEGRLVWTGTGRFDFARVLATTLGPLRARRVLRRLERASWRFPPHPRGFERTYYELDFTVRFKGGRPG